MKIEYPIIKKSNLLSDQVYNFLKNIIVEKKLVSGEKISERKIAKNLNVSVTPVREALRKLSMEGFITLNAHQSAIVNAISDKDFEDIMLVREALEGVAARLATKKLNKERIKKLEKKIKEMENLTPEKKKISFSTISSEFHSMIVNFSENKKLINFHKNLYEQTNLFRYQLLYSEKRIKSGIIDHQKILEKMKNGQPDQASSLSQKHVRIQLKYWKEQKHKDIL